MNNTKKWFLIDNCLTAKGQIFDEQLPCSTKEEATALATREWNALSTADQKRRDAFYVGYADTDEEGCVDYNTMTDIVTIK